jgi:hypothetical protein
MLSADVSKKAGGADAGPSIEVTSAAEHESHWKLIEEVLNILRKENLQRISCRNAYVIQQFLSGLAGSHQD